MDAPTRTGRADLRVDLIQRIQGEHTIVGAGTREASGGEYWRCKCGESYKGEGSIKRGRRHDAAAILAGLIEAGVVD